MAKNKKRKALPILIDEKIIDSHCHLDMEPYHDDLDELINRAIEAGLAAILTIGIDLTSSRKAIAIAQKYNQVFATVGIHPHNAKEVTKASLNALGELATNNKVVGFGEIGIDRFKDYAPIKDQQAAFSSQLALSYDLKLPVIIHNREAHDEILTIIKQFPPPPVGGVIHCFSGNTEQAKQFLDLGFHLSIPGVVTFKKATDCHDVAKYIPLDRLLVETDGPFLTPMPYRGKRNEPAFVLYTAEKIAQLRDISISTLAKQTTKNTINLFKLPIK